MLIYGWEEVQLLGAVSSSPTDGHAHLDLDFVRSLWRVHEKLGREKREKTEEIGLQDEAGRTHDYWYTLGEIIYSHT